MVRPIEISDVLSKIPAAERILQNAKTVPEAAQQFQKELGEKLAGEQTTTTQPASSGDQIILHADEREKNRQEKHGHREKDCPESSKTPDAGDNPDTDPPADPGHIDIQA